MAVRGTRPPPTDAIASNGLFRRYRVMLRARLGEQRDAIAVEILARTQGAARRVARLEHPGCVIDAIERID